MNLKNNENLNEYPILNVAFIGLLSFISLFYLTICQSFISAKFYSDSSTIKLGLYYPNMFSKSIRNTSIFFRDIGFNYFTPVIYIHLFDWLVFVLILITLLRINKFNTFSCYQMMLIVIFMIMYGCYFGHYSKDIICLLFFVIFINIHPINNDVVNNIIIAVGLYGCLFRSYWLIVFFISIIFMVLNNYHNRINIRKNICYLFFIMILFIIIFDLVHHGFITDIKANVNKNLLMQYSNIHATINNLFTNSSIITDCINYMYSLISLLMPIQGFSSFNVIIYYLWIVFIFIIIFTHKKEINWKTLLVLIIYLNVQALFEPNFGSVLRHQLAWFPILYYTL